MTLTEFLEARIGEDEAIARKAAHDPGFGTGETWTIEPDNHHPWHTGLQMAVAESTWDACIAPGQAEHTARWDPARVLVECASKRAILAECSEWYPTVRGGLAVCKDIAETILLALAVPYADHPDYDEAWRP